MEQSRTTLAIEGMSCSHCIAAVQQALMAVPGIMVARVALGSAQLEIEASLPAQVVSSAVHALERAGYDAKASADAVPALAPTSCCGAPKTHRLAHA